MADGIAKGDTAFVVSLLRKLTPAQASVVLSRHYLYGERDQEAFGTPLHLAAFLGDEDIVRALIRFAFEIPHGMALFALGDTAVAQIAAAEGATSVLALLLEAADRNPSFAPFILAPNRFGNAVYAAVGRGHLEVLALLLSFIAPHGVLKEERANLLLVPNLIYRSPLYFAVLTGNSKAARMILTFASRHPGLIPLVLQEGPDGENVLEAAAFLGATETAAVLLDFLPDERFRRFILHSRAFHAAATHYQMEIVKLNDQTTSNTFAQLASIQISGARS